MQARAYLQRMPCRRANAQRAHARIAGLAQLYPSALPRTSCEGRLPMQVTMGTHARISRRDVLARTSREDCACSSHEGYACPRKLQGRACLCKSQGPCLPTQVAMGTFAYVSRDGYACPHKLQGVRMPQSRRVTHTRTSCRDALAYTGCRNTLPTQISNGTLAYVSRDGYACPRKPQGTRLHPAIPIREHGGIDAVPAAQTPAAQFIRD